MNMDRQIIEVIPIRSSEKLMIIPGGGKAPWRRCNNCRGTYPESHFSKTKTQCRGCKSEKTKERAIIYQPIKKCKMSAKRHAISHGISFTLLWNEYSWKTSLEEIGPAYKVGCSLCGNAYSDYNDMTVDIRDEKAPLAWGINTCWMCRKCNSAKQHMSHENWLNYCWHLKLWKENKKNGGGNDDGSVQLGLFIS